MAGLANRSSDAHPAPISWTLVSRRFISTAVYCQLIVSGLGNARKSKVFFSVQYIGVGYMGFGRLGERGARTIASRFMAGIFDI